ncbi:hypothetical protein PYCCODRAFT_1474517 [Trametes coccinea BRFM310]|uniref:Uncharacterized protein n=1 Tax=Trametes coccinea (strain BRFM310) TaxID=1353009 RepID=A0A1Y2J1N0_TRAC3|nr:hypothetical protein PYCCODRAFT_1474517 [Trametes coccinea BRFM310]
MRGLASSSSSTDSSKDAHSRQSKSKRQDSHAAVDKDSADTTAEYDASPLQEPTRKMTLAERDAALMNSWKEREGSFANAEFEDGQVAEGYRRNVKANIFRYI